MPLLEHNEIMEVYNKIKLKLAKIETGNVKAKKILGTMDNLRDGYTPYNLDEL